MSATDNPTSPRAETLDLPAIRRRLADRQGRAYWRSLEELAETPEFHAFLAREFPRQAAPLDGALDRRGFLKLMSASLALAGLGACTRQPAETIMPYATAPEDLVPGEPLFYATAMPLAGGATGVLVESHMGRPTKIEGNPLHPASLGATDAFAQASILTLYDPDRSQVATSAGEIRPWSAFLDALRTAVAGERRTGGAGFRLLTEVVTSPTLAAQIRAVLAEFPEARWHQYEPAARDGAYAGARMAFGRPVDTHYDLARADVVVALDADLLGAGPARLRHTRDFSRRRRPDDGPMSRLYVAECSPSITGGVADHRLPLRAHEIEQLAWSLAQALDPGVQAPATLAGHDAWVRAVAADLTAHRGRSLVVAGDEQPAAVHALAHAMNAALDNVGATVVYSAPIAAEPTAAIASLAALVADMDAERVDLLLILGGNPVVTAPADLGFAERLAKVDLRVHLGLYDDETSRLCHWHLPETHYLEAWSDTRAADGTVTIMQPLIAPLYEGRSAHEVLSSVSDETPRSGYDVVRAYWQGHRSGGDFERFWRRALHDGVVPDSAEPAVPVDLQFTWAAAARAALREPAGDGLEIQFRLDPSVFDGRFANNGWLQELPRPLTKLTWDNAALVSPRTAERLGVGNEDVVELIVGGRKVSGPVWILPGQADGVVTVHLGYGRTRAGRIAAGAGFDAFTLRTVAAPWGGPGLDVRPTGTRHPLACTQHHHGMEGRHLVREATLAEYRAHPHFAHDGAHEPGPDMTLYPPHPYEGYAWGMAIDLATCTGCNACVVACQAENNIPVVGKEQVALGREMQWLRIDRYYEGEIDTPTIHHQPVPCMHCENAPCELVCPVNATVHGDEGLNEMIYNRCVGTRYCSNNCPYKVRRFNFYLYSDWTTESLKLGANPDVTVRSRGVMEKCTYCVQRINRGRIQAKNEDRTLRDGEVVPACQQVCPAEAIAFGDVNDPASKVATLKQHQRNYALLAELNTRPRTTYLAGVRNPNPALDDGRDEGYDGGGHEHS
jgi:molybdopterin-containing oxidoreductase family iron-sulfur binding subunit